MIFMIFLNFMIEWTVMIFLLLMMGQMIMCCIEKWKLMYQLKNTSFVASVFLPRRVCFNLKMAKNFCDRERPQDWIWWILQNGQINFSISFGPLFGPFWSFHAFPDWIIQSRPISVTAVLGHFEAHLVMIFDQSVTDSNPLELLTYRV